MVVLRGFEIGLEIGVVGLRAAAGLSSSNFDANGFLSGTVFLSDANTFTSNYKIRLLGASFVYAVNFTATYKRMTHIKLCTLCTTKPHVA